ncbi:hypothetical protein XELAEV_180016511mg, partial [Xenopus laevis]
LFYVSRGHAAP